MDGSRSQSREADALAVAVRAASLLIFASQMVYLPWRFQSPVGPEGIIFDPVVGSALLLPLALARRGKGVRNMSFLFGSVVAVLSALGIAEDAHRGTNSTSALNLLIIPPLQWLIMIIALAVGAAITATAMPGCPDVASPSLT